MKVLYLTNIHNPYRDEFFEQLGRVCDLTVLFEARCDSERDVSWFKGVHARNYVELYLPSEEQGLISRTMLDLIGRRWSLVIVGCYNTPRQMVAIEIMKHRGIPYVVNSDGFVFDNGGPLKRAGRRRVLKGADAYLVAGETCVPSLRRIVGRRAKVYPYPMTSLNKRRVEDLATNTPTRDPRTVLVVGQYKDYKGLDVALDMASDYCGNLNFRFIGAGKRSTELKAEVDKRGLSNVTIVPFMNQRALTKEFQSAGLFVLPSRQECWGLVINEAAACGCPIVSTWGSGAAIDFISRDYPKLLAEPGDARSLSSAIKAYFKMSDIEKHEYSSFLSEKSKSYTIEKMVEIHIGLISEIAS